MSGSCWEASANHANVKSLLTMSNPSLIRSGWINALGCIILASLCWALLATFFYGVSAFYMCWLLRQPLRFADIIGRASYHGLRMWRSWADIIFLTLTYLLYRLRLHSKQNKSLLVHRNTPKQCVDYAVLASVMRTVVTSSFVLFLVCLAALTIQAAVHVPPYL